MSEPTQHVGHPTEAAREVLLAILLYGKAVLVVSCIFLVIWCFHRYMTKKTKKRLIIAYLVLTLGPIAGTLLMIATYMVGFLLLHYSGLLR